MQQPFQEWSESLNTEQIITLLTDLQRQGHTIIFGKPPLINGWTILGDATRWVGVRPQGTTASGMWDICVGNLGRSIGSASSINDLRGYLQAAMRGQGMSITTPPSQVVLEEKEPVSNMAKIVAIIRGASITALWDSYITNQTLSCLTDLTSLGTNLSPNLMILTASQTINQSVNNSRLSSTFFNSFKTQSADNAEIRLCNKQHDRFMLLSDGRCISPDFSLNKVGNRGTVNEIGDPTNRTQWFNNEWANGTVWPYNPKLAPAELTIK